MVRGSARGGFEGHCFPAREILTVFLVPGNAAVALQSGKVGFLSLKGRDKFNVLEHLRVFLGGVLNVDNILIGVFVRVYVADQPEIRIDGGIAQHRGDLGSVVQFLFVLPDDFKSCKPFIGVVAVSKPDREVIHVVHDFVVSVYAGENFCGFFHGCGLLVFRAFRCVCGCFGVCSGCLSGICRRGLFLTCGVRSVLFFSVAGGEKQKTEQGKREQRQK